MKKLLLHACCAPCLTSSYKQTMHDFLVVPFWFNPNIEDKQEYNKRLDSFKRLTNKLGCNYIRHSESLCDEESDVSVIPHLPALSEAEEMRDPNLLVDPRVISLGEAEPRRKPEDDGKGGNDTTTEKNQYQIDNLNWQKEIQGLENEKEGGKRCEKCIKFRLEETARKAKKNQFDIFGTTMTVSPRKNASTINKIGNNLAQKYKIDFLSANFKKKDGYFESVKLSKKYKLYRQNYCGCRYSSTEKLKSRRFRNIGIPIKSIGKLKNRGIKEPKEPTD